MLDATNVRLAVIDEGDWPFRQNTKRDGGLGSFLENLRQRRHMIMYLTLVGAAVGWLASLAYVAIRVPAFSASSEILISNTTLQLSGQDAVVTQILVENSLVESAIELLRSSAYRQDHVPCPGAPPMRNQGLRTRPGGKRRSRC
jgi:hypothetical protein